jgi:tRNA pseudouridine38-40 synthase
MKYRAILAYDGTRYQGFQRQAPGIPTIQGRIEEALQTVTGQSVTVIGAGRTDTGVHATGQVIAFELEQTAWRHSAAALLNALNATLPDDIALQSLDIEPDERFHPRFSASSRMYEYTVLTTAQRQPLLAQRVWHLRQTLDIEMMQQAARLLIGEHDFATFGQPPAGTNTVRYVFRSEWEAQDTLWVYRVQATAFLQHMVRRMVGMMVDVGRGRLSIEQFEADFQAADLTRAKTLAPPQGLVLVTVEYLPHSQ